MTALPGWWQDGGHARYGPTERVHSSGVRRLSQQRILAQENLCDHRGRELAEPLSEGILDDWVKTLRIIDRRLIQGPKWRFRRWLAIRRRRARAGVIFIGVTGSAGKTTTTKLIHAVAARAGVAGIGLHNWDDGVVRDMLTVRRDYAVWVQEVSGHYPGAVAKAVGTLRPRIGVVTTVGSDHRSAFRTTEATAKEKGLMVELLPPDGVAILNADDPLVRAMAGRTGARVVLIGEAVDATVRAVDVEAQFPGTLSLTVLAQGQSVRVYSNYVGRYWLTAIVAAIACGLELDLTLEECAAAIAAHRPTLGRNSVHRSRTGAIYVMDSHKAPYWTLPLGLAVVANAEATRKTVVFGTISDYSGARTPTYRKAARAALAVADRVIFVGGNAYSAANTRSGDLAGRVMAFDAPAPLHAFLMENTIPGELVYVKGSSGADHLERLVLAETAGVACWISNCGRSPTCDTCQYRTRRRGQQPAVPAIVARL